MRCPKKYAFTKGMTTYKKRKYDIISRAQSVLVPDGPEKKLDRSIKARSCADGRSQ